MIRNDKPILSDPDRITVDMMGPGRCRDYNISIDPHITPPCVKNADTRILPSRPIIYEIGHRTYQVNEFGMANFYVLVGTERGLVIDCGCGSIDAKALIEHLCPLPYDVVITHGHGDHCGAMNQFDRVWLMPQDFPLVKDSFRVNQQLWENPNIWRSHKATYPDGTTVEYPGSGRGGMDYYDYTSLTFMGVDTEHLPELCPLYDGQVFHLGQRDVTVLHIPGHSQGCAVFIDPQTRIAFTGDAFDASFNIMRNTPQENVVLLRKFQNYRSDFDRMFPGHTAVGYETANFSQSPELLEDTIAAYQSVVDGTAACELREFHGRMIKMAVYGKACVPCEKVSLFPQNEPKGKDGNGNA